MSPQTALAILLVLAGCGGLAPRSEPTDPAWRAAPAAVVTSPVAAEATPAAKPSAPSKAPAPAPSPPASQAAAKPGPSALPVRAATPAIARPATPPLDLRSLEQRLKETNAIGVLTKLSLKNQVDDLVARFRAFHSGQRPPTLPELRPSFELLLMKVLSLLQDRDTALANEINASRDAIWGVLTDRDKLSQYL